MLSFLLLSLPSLVKLALKTPAWTTNSSQPASSFGDFLIWALSLLAQACSKGSDVWRKGEVLIMVSLISPLMQTTPAFWQLIKSSGCVCSFSHISYSLLLFSNHLSPRDANNNISKLRIKMMDVASCLSGVMQFPVAWRPVLQYSFNTLWVNCA